ncbi:phage head morphogenesis protein [Frigidibacter sp. MR17.24]|uniref:phage head morphogenesis protein n=1 Tax=Frigidibacter sp. MR17.24 TaxID=3127345 RepID=UPI003013116E
MPDVNETIFDAEVRHQVYLGRFSAGVARRIIALLNRTNDDLVKRLRELDTEWTLARVDALLDAVREMNRGAYEELAAMLGREVESFAGYEAEFQARTIDRSLPVRLDVVTPAREQVYAAAMARPFQGRLLREWMAGLEAGAAQRVRDAVRIGFVEGETVDQIVRRVRGTRARQYEDGILQISRRDAATIVRTAINHTANVARNATYEANGDLIKGIRWVSTLDGRTSAVCRARDGEVYPVDKGPRPPAHHNCRSTTAPVTKSWRELGFDIDDLPPATRASMNGQVPGDQTYDGWLRRQSNEFQADVLGVEKAKLFRDGMKLDRFVDRAGRELTLDELRRLEA